MRHILQEEFCFLCVPFGSMIKFQFLAQFSVEHLLHSLSVLSYNPFAFANGPGDLGSIPGHVIPTTFKMVLDTFLLNTQ